jgi:hypothetical protein
MGIVVFLVRARPDTPAGPSQQATPFSECFKVGSSFSPIEWLLPDSVTYAFWLPKDHAGVNSRFQPLFGKVESRYFWCHMYPNDKDFAIGLPWRKDGPR